MSQSWNRSQVEYELEERDAMERHGGGQTRISGHGRNVGMEKQQSGG